MRPNTSVSWLLAAADDLATCLQFFSRLPVPEALLSRRERPPLALAMRMVPVAGLVIGTCGVVALALADLLELPSALAAVAAVACLVLTTGGLHEDALADTADGLGGGRSIEHKLTIMRDSRIGTYGVLAVSLALILRIACLATLLDRAGLRASVAAILASAALSRTLALLPMLFLNPARADGVSQAAGRPPMTTAGVGLALAGLLALGLPALTRLGLPHAALGVVLAGVAALAVIEMARRHIGGHTGDIAGTAQQAAEVAFLVGLLCFPS